MPKRGNTKLLLQEVKIKTEADIVKNIEKNCIRVGLTTNKSPCKPFQLHINV